MIYSETNGKLNGSRRWMLNSKWTYSFFCPVSPCFYLSSLPYVCTLFPGVILEKSYFTIRVSACIYSIAWQIQWNINYRKLMRITIKEIKKFFIGDVLGGEFSTTATFPCNQTMFHHPHGTTRNACSWNHIKQWTTRIEMTNREENGGWGERRIVGKNTRRERLPEPCAHRAMNKHIEFHLRMKWDLI